MKTVLLWVAIMILAWLFALCLPFYGLAIAALLAALIVNDTPTKSGLAGFVAGASLWFVASYVQHTAGDGLVAERLANSFGVETSLLLVLTALLGGLLGSFGALTGSLIRKT